MSSLKRWLVRGVLGSRRVLFRGFAAFPRRVACNVCRWSGRRFLSDGWHEGIVCPRCDAGVRHRLLVAVMSDLERFSFERLCAGRDVLHFAAEPPIVFWLALREMHRVLRPGGTAVHVLAPPRPSPRRLATNERRVYFAQRAGS